MKVGLTGGTPVMLEQGGTYYGVAVDATSIYFSDQFDIRKVGLEGGTPVGLDSEVEIDYGAPLALTIDATNAYWSDYAFAIRKVGLNGGTPVTLATEQQISGDDLGGDTDIAVDATSVYWSNCSAGTIMRVAK